MTHDPTNPINRSEPGHGAPTPADPEPQASVTDDVGALDSLRLEGEVGKLRHESAQRRRQLREVEAERDALRERVNGHDRAEIERRASEELHDTADLFSVTSLEDLRGDDGALDAGKLDTVLETIKREKPHWMKQDPNPPYPDLHQGARQSAAAGPSFGAALKKGGRR